MSFYVGDFSDEALIVTPSRGGEDIEIFDDTLEAVLLGPDGVPVTPAPTAAVVDGEASVTFSGPFTVAGVYRLQLTAVRGAAARVGLDEVRIIVEDRDGWHTLHTARDAWRDAPGNDVTLHTLLTLARDEVAAFARIGTSLTTLRQAQLMQARSLLNAAKVDPSGTSGDGTFESRPRPLDWMVKQILRPKTAVPKVM